MRSDTWWNMDRFAREYMNLISWNGRAPKYDLREWSPEHDKMGKGVTLSKEELEALKDLLQKM